jgi:hypothetical protein
MTTGLLEKASGEYAQLRKRRQELKEEEVRLREELTRVHAQGRGQDQEYDIGNRLRAIAEELWSMQGVYAIAERKAQEEAVKRITESVSYREAVRNAAQGLGEALAGWLALEAIVAEARRGGVGLPVSVGALLAEAKAWLKRSVAAGALDVADLPVPLKALVKGEK